MLFKNATSSYRIVTDSACDMGADILNEWEVPFPKLTLKFTGDETEYRDTELDLKTFYDRMRAGESAKTSAVNPEAFKPVFEEVLSAGQDVLYLGFSSGLSTTVNSGRIAAMELARKYPQRQIITIDTLCASAGVGLLIYLTLKRQAEGATLEQAAEYAEKTKGKLCHWFTVDSLEYLKRGGRISPSVAFVGSLLGIKPVLFVDDGGHLVNVSKVRGRQASVKMLAEKLKEAAVGGDDGEIFICHGDCSEDAQLLSVLVREAVGREITKTVYTGAVIGSHSGPGTLAIFFVGRER